MKHFCLLFAIPFSNGKEMCTRLVMIRFERMLSPFQPFLPTFDGDLSLRVRHPTREGRVPCAMSCPQRDSPCQPFALSRAK